jgi:aminotransferase
MIPPTVPNHIVHAGHKVGFYDDTKWVGNPYDLFYLGDDCTIVDSAQQVLKCKCHHIDDIYIYSFYPTKPLSGIDGGMICCSNIGIISRIRELVYYGMSQSEHSWERVLGNVGWKAYMNTAQAMVAMESLSQLDNKLAAIRLIRNQYNNAFGLDNTSDHLYRINIKDRDKFIDCMRGFGIRCGVHYDTAHKTPIYRWLGRCPLSDKEAQTTVSIPMHEAMSDNDIIKVIDKVKKYAEFT